MHTLQWVINRYKKTIVKLIWNDKPPKVKYSCLINTLENGGMKLQDIETKITASKTKWIHKIIDTEFKAP